MKVLFISDIHGSDQWNQIIADNFFSVDKVIFLGDYLDSFDVMPDYQKDNLKEIIKLKKKYSKKVTLLLGNHDYAYIFNYIGISGYNVYFSHDYKEILDKNWELFDIATGFGQGFNYTLVTHAGLNKSYFDKLVFETSNYLNWNKPIHENLNLLKDKKDLLWIVGRDRGGVVSYPSVLWADVREIKQDPYPNINQVFGHTPLSSNYIIKHGNNFLMCIDNRYNVQSIILDL